MTIPNRNWQGDPLNIDYLVESGLLYELNRTVLHPVGVSLVVDETTNTLGLLDFRSNPEAAAYSATNVAANAKKYLTFMMEFGQGQEDRREEKLGKARQEPPKKMQTQTGKRTASKRFPPKYGSDGHLTAAQHLAFMTCERLAKKEKRHLPDKFWTQPFWKKTYARQVTAATNILNRLDPKDKGTGVKAVIRVLTSTEKGKSAYSFGAPFLWPLIEQMHKTVLVEHQAAAAASSPNPEDRAVLPLPPAPPTPKTPPARVVLGYHESLLDKL